jgi:hypothetical protein
MIISIMGTIWGVRISMIDRQVKRILGVLSGLLMATWVNAQFIPDDPDWKEVDVPAPPAFDLKRLIPVEVSRQSQLQWGIDPETIKITSDGIVRYVVVAQSSSGVVNAMYEGLRCNKAESRTYARHNPDSGWVKAGESEWKPLRDVQRSSHASAISRQGLCIGAAPPTNAREGVQRLREAARGNAASNGAVR